MALKEMDCAESVTPMIMPGVLLRQQALGDDDIKPDGGDQRGDGDAEGERLMPQHPLQARVIRVEHRLKHRSVAVKEPPVLLVLSGLKRRAHIIGVSVSETMADTTTATLKVMANSRNSRPTMPVMKSSGMNTAISETLSEMTVNPICFAPLSAASRGVSPVSMKRTMFSIITMASSTTKPVEMVSAISERLSRLKPISFMTPNVPMMRERQRHAGDHRGPEFPQEDEDHHHHQHHRQHQGELHVRDRGADGLACGRSGWQP